MGIIKAALNAIGGGLADQWLEVIEPQGMSDTTVMTTGARVRGKDRRNGNLKGTDFTVSNGSVIHVDQNQFMMLVDGGKIVDYTAEPGYYTVNNSSLPSLFNGQFGEALTETFNRFKYGGTAPSSQKVYYINLQEIKGIKFGTRNPINYFDNFYNAELFLRTHGSYSIKVIEPIKFFMEAIPRDRESVDINDINEQYLNEFLTALQAAINQMSIDGIRISHVASKSMELAKYMGDILDSDWGQMRGMQVYSVGIGSISYDEESQKLINMRNQGAMMQDPSIREGFVQSSIAKGLEAAGSNQNGAMAGFMGMGIGMQGSGSFMGAASETNRQQMHEQQANQPTKAATVSTNEWKCSCGATSIGKFCNECGNPKPINNTWTCKCGAQTSGKFCSECGAKKPEKVKCNKCGYEPSETEKTPKFCPECGDPFNEADINN